jgi:hypothetical protein
MSIEHILKSAGRGKKKKHRGNGIAAVDERYTGTEPIWDDWKSWPIAKFHNERSRMFGFYNYYSNAKDLKPAVLEWMANNGYTKQQIRAVKRAPDYLPGVTVGSLCTSMNRGMPDFHPELQAHLETLAGCAGSVVVSDAIFCKERINQAIAEGDKSEDVIEGEEPKVKKVSGPSPMELLIRKVQATILMDLDVQMDKWMDQKPGEKLETFDIYERMKSHGLPALVTDRVKRWLAKHRDEMKAALEKTDPDLVEGYRYLTTAQLKERVDTLSQYITDLDKFKSAVKASKAPREKKLPSATKLVEKLQYMKESPEHKISSINPVRLIGAHRVITFSTRDGYIRDYRSSSGRGFLLSGSTLKNVDEATMRAKKLRKPERDLQTFVTGSSKNIEKLWTELTTKDAKPNTRINEHMVILRVFEEPNS